MIVWPEFSQILKVLIQNQFKGGLISTDFPWNSSSLSTRLYFSKGGPFYLLLAHWQRSIKYCVLHPHLMDLAFFGSSCHREDGVSWQVYHVHIAHASNSYLFICRFNSRIVSPILATFADYYGLHIKPFWNDHRNTTYALMLASDASWILVTFLPTRNPKKCRMKKRWICFRPWVLTQNLKPKLKAFSVFQKLIL